MGEKHPLDMAALFALAKQGDAEAMDYLFHVLRQRVSQVARYYVREGDVEDVVQEAMIAFSGKFDALDGPEALIPFCLRILKNKIGNYLQKDRGKRNVPLEDVTLFHSTTPHSVIESEELQSKIKAALDVVGRRSEEFRKLSLLLGSGCSMPEIIKAFGAGDKEALYSRIYRFRTRLKEVLRKNHGMDL